MSHPTRIECVKNKSRFMNLLTGPKAFIVTIIVAFCESSFFPFPPDIGIVSLILHDRRQAWRLAFWCSIASVLGGLGGYAIGVFLFDHLGSVIIHTYGLQERFATLEADFQSYGFWILLFKGLTPIPYKLLTIASGVFKFSLLQFTLASIIARAGRFYVLAGLLWYFGPMAKPYFERFFGWITFATIAIIVLGFWLVKFL